MGIIERTTGPRAETRAVFNEVRAFLEAHPSCMACERSKASIVRSGPSGRRALCALCSAAEETGGARSSRPTGQGTAPPVPPPPDDKVEYHGRRVSPEVLRMLGGVPDHIHELGRPRPPIG